MRFIQSISRAGLIAAAFGIGASPAEGGVPLCAAPPFEAEPNGTTGTATVLQSPCWSYRGAVATVNDVDYFRLNAINASRIWLLVDTGEPPDQNHDTDSTLQLYATDGVTLIEEDDDDGNGNGGDGMLETSLSSAIAGRVVHATGNYFLRVRNLGVNLIDRYQLVTMATFSGNGSDEAEPNGTPATANVADLASRVRISTLSPAGDSDYYRFVAKAGELLFVAADGNPERDGSNTDVDLELRAGDGATILYAATTTNSGDGMGAEAFRYVVPTGGTYYVRAFGHAPGTTGTYDLLIAGNAELFLDGFESGDTDAWSSESS
jgi:hypothetical protein